MINSRDKLLNFNYDALSDVITIEGIRYSGELFRSFASDNKFPINQLFKIVKREDDTITIQIIESK